MSTTDVTAEIDSLKHTLGMIAHSTSDSPDFLRFLAACSLYKNFSIEDLTSKNVLPESINTAISIIESIFDLYIMPEWHPISNGRLLLSWKREEEITMILIDCKFIELFTFHKGKIIVRVSKNIFQENNALLSDMLKHIPKKLDKIST